MVSSGIETRKGLLHMCPSFLFRGTELKERGIMKKKFNTVLTVEEVSKILRIARNTIQGRRWQKRSGCPLFKKGKRLYVETPKFWEWFKNGENN